MVIKLHKYGDFRGLFQVFFLPLDHYICLSDDVLQYDIQANLSKTTQYKPQVQSGLAEINML